MDSLLGIISAGIPLLMLVPLSFLTSRTRWDTHNAIIGTSCLSWWTTMGLTSRAVHVLYHDGRCHPDHQGAQVMSCGCVCILMYRCRWDDRDLT